MTRNGGMTGETVYEMRRACQGEELMGLTLKEKEAIAGLTAEELKQRSKELRRKWQVDNREKIYEKKRQWVEANRESHNAKKREWYHANKDEITAKQRKR